MKCFLKSFPRSVALKVGPDVLIFESCGKSIESLTCIVKFCKWDDVDCSEYSLVAFRAVYGCMGLINIENNIFICLITGYSQVAAVRSMETVNRIHDVEFLCLNSSLYDNFSRNFDENSIEFNISELFDSFSKQNDFEHPCDSIRKLLLNGSFYFSSNFDLTRRIQDRYIFFYSESDFNIDKFDDQFLWNSYMISELLIFRSRLVESEKFTLDKGGFLVSVIRGFVGTVLCKIGSVSSTLILISRLSCKKAGTRFNSRGVDDNGNVANFVETETLLILNDLCFSFCQIRGSVPGIFSFNNIGIQVFGQKVEITRSFEATHSSFEKHFESLINKYGYVHIVNLLCQNGGEKLLLNSYRQHIDSLKGNLFHSICSSEFDFHAEVKCGGYDQASKIFYYVDGNIKNFSYYLEDMKKKNVILQQGGIFRTNCLDCLDRTNLVQALFSKASIMLFLKYLDVRQEIFPWSEHSIVWADNGDALSKIYTGTGALKSGFTRRGKMSIVGVLEDATKSVGRMYINNFQDKGRQLNIDLLLGRLVNQKPVRIYDPINEFVATELQRRINEFSTMKNISIFVSTFNLNGKKKTDDLSLWLFPNGRKYKSDLVVIGFQEIIELTPQQMISVDSYNRKVWESDLYEVLNRDKNEYILLRSGQLVGSVLMIFVKEASVPFIKNVEGAVKKTGLKGISGNKGAVAIRMDYGSTQICFVTAHFAAGRFNCDERNRDYFTIANGLTFQRGRVIMDHDIIIWLGDFNYRINMNAEEVKEHIKVNDFEKLYKNDQLNLQMISGSVFPYYSESQIIFPPTYKFDNGTNNYNTSEKQRTPSWTDRILYKGSNLRQLSYNSSPLTFSDHKPVYAHFEASITIIDEEFKEKLRKEIYNFRKLRIEQSNNNDIVRDMIDSEDTYHLKSDKKKFMFLSTDKKKKCLENMFLKAAIKSPSTESVSSVKSSLGFFHNIAKSDKDKRFLSMESNLGSHVIEKPRLPPRPRVSPMLLMDKSSSLGQAFDVELSEKLSKMFVHSDENLSEISSKSSDIYFKKKKIK
ncbi:uncharacterized protein T551_00818 [Pneumocystis jirovecii RU7]|uniref:phosphoinositide 5-phosphatase n=1 Tax=Pneumocystis jirovecii (strain RU7) TaxID=1408657 RepID=A0A0W4ZUU3_PNEJ7|nr:uncharacterized protein T551_00818 [Pneumocystis jirovecii RU7]KTW32136.1 hypothetical protein T551_00818 [Pneumocystis jirovecii RU7]